MKIAIASDHGGVHLKATISTALRAEGHEIEDLGTHDESSCDYPDYAHAVAKAITGGGAERGILVCGSGVGMSITANKHPGIRAVVCSDVYSAKMSRQHNDANVLCLGERVVGPGLAWDIVSIWIRETASGDRHALRRAKIELG